MSTKYSILNPKRHKYYNYLMVIGCLSIILEIWIYRNTIIEIKIPLLVILITGLFTAIIDFPRYKSTYSNQSYKSFIVTLFVNTIGWGFICCTIFMASNKYLSSHESTKKNYEIHKWGSISGINRLVSKRQPTFVIIYQDEDKEFVFSNHYFEDRLVYKEIEIETKRGFFGFDIIESKKLIK